MRFLDLGLLAFGPFTERHLDLSGPKLGGLHVIYGKNEAGKSTALRAVTALLFGIAERPEDAHLHAAKDLKLSGVIEEGGRSLSFMRRKRRKDSLRTPLDEPLEEAALAEFLHGVDKTLFKTLFGLDHERLKQGGQALLEGEGDVAEGLFDAGTGGRGIHVLLDALGAEADLLFKPRASKPRLNLALAEYKKAKKQARDEVRAPEKYLAQLEQAERARERRDALLARLAELRERQELLRRILRTLKPLARRKQCLEELKGLGAVPELASNTPERRSKAQQVIASCTREALRAEREIERRRAELEALPDEHAILEISERTVDELRDKVGIHRKAAQDLPKRKAEIKEVEAEAKRILERMGHAPELARAESLRLTTKDTATIRRLARERELEKSARDAVGRRLRAAERQLGEQQRALKTSGPVIRTGALAAAVRQARGSSDLMARLLQCRRELSDARDARELLSQRVFPGLEEPEIDVSRVPELEAIEAYRVELEHAAGESERLYQELVRIDEELRESDRQIEAIQSLGPVVSEEQLLKERKKRDESWEVVLLAWRKGRGPDQAEGKADKAPPPARAFERAMAAADETADRLRREADRVAQLKRLEVRQAELAPRLVATQDAKHAADEALAMGQATWFAAWNEVPVEVGNPLDMIAWRRRFDELMKQELTYRKASREVDRLETEHGDRFDALTAAVVGVGETPARELVALSEQASELLTRITESERQRQEMQARISQLDAEVDEERRALEGCDRADAEWQKEWQRAVAPLMIGECPGVDETLAVLDDLGELMRKLDELPSKRGRVLGIERDARQFDEELRPLLSRYAPDLEELPIDRAAEQLVRRHRDARQYEQERARLEAQLTELRAELAASQERERSARQELAELVAEAGAADVRELEHLERLAEQKASLEARLREQESQLLEEGDGVSIEELSGQARGRDRASLVPELEALETEIDDVDKASRDLEGEISALVAGLEYYEDRAAADSAQNFEQRAAEARDLLHRYLRVRLAKTVLERELARYRERNQGPVLSRAGELFERLTLGSYRTLRAGLEERALGCVRADGEEVRVTELSEGAQYQLHLALRLATFEHYTNEQATVPLVFDDLLIHFDDERAKAAFSVLGDLAKRVQILYFTHLARDLGLSRDAVDRGVLRQHRLTVHEVPASRASAALSRS